MFPTRHNLSALALVPDAAARRGSADGYRLAETNKSVWRDFGVRSEAVDRP